VIWMTLLTMLVGLLLWARRRRVRAGVLAGRDAEKPTYQVEPPHRRMGIPLKDGRL